MERTVWPRTFWILRLFLWAFILGVAIAAAAQAQGSNSSGQKSGEQTAKPNDSPANANGAQAYSGMYNFRKEGEFIQLTVEDDGSVTGFVSRYGDGESDKGTFLDQFFKTAKLDGNKLTFMTEIVHGTSFEFKGTIVRGEGKNPGEEGYFVLQGTLTENITDVNKKVTSHTRDVAFKMFPQEATSEGAK
jgi:hypothetical protein